MIDPVSAREMLQLILAGTRLASHAIKSDSFKKINSFFLQQFGFGNTKSENSSRKSSSELKKAELKYYRDKSKRDLEDLNIQKKLASIEKQRLNNENILVGVAEVNLEIDKQHLNIESLRLDLENRKLQLSEQERKDRLKIGQLHREMLRDIQIAETEVKLIEIQTIWDKDTWLSKISREETKSILNKYKHCLLILTGPPNIDPQLETAKDFQEWDFSLDMNKVDDFLCKYYPPQSEVHPVQFFSDYFQKPIRKLDVERLQNLMSPISTYILRCDIKANAVIFRISHWQAEMSAMRSFPPFEWDWQANMAELISQGKSIREATNVIKEAIIEIHRLLTAYSTDLYYLSIDPTYEPQLFQILSQEEEKFFESYIKSLQEIQKHQQETYYLSLKQLAEENAKLALECFKSGYEKLNDPQGALADYNQAISFDPNYALAYLNRGNLKYVKLNDPQGALADYNQAISLNPNYASAYSNRGLLKADKLNDLQGALADYNQAISLNPNYASAYSNRGLLKADKLNDLQGALADYDQAVILNPQNADIYIYHGLLKANKLNDPQGALADYDQAVILNPQNADIYIYRGNLKYVKLNDPQGALADYNQAIALDPKDALAYSNRGLLKANKLNDLQGALADYNQAISLNPNYASVYGNRRQFIRKDVELEMIYIPGGSFVMGAPVSEEGAGDDERPQHKVTLSPFWIGKYPVTQKQYTALMGNNPAHFQGDDLPVENVSWEDAVAFCEKLSNETKKNYRLPSEAEWEYACRAGTTTPFHFGEELSPELANYGRNVGQTSICSKYPANAFGLHDMHGNVWEWCQDTWHKNYECKSNDTTNSHILRGGSWLNYPKHCRSARRVKNSAVDKLNYIGFRVLLFQ